MPYEILAVEKDRLVRVNHSGTIDLEELNEAREKARAVMQVKGFTKIFVDATKVTNNLAMTEHFVFTASHKVILPPNVKIAIVMSAKFFKRNQYIEEAAESTGTNLRTFAKKGEAKAWLLGGE